MWDCGNLTVSALKHAQLRMRETGVKGVNFAFPIPSRDNYINKSSHSTHIYTRGQCILGSSEEKSLRDPGRSPKRDQSA